MAEAEAIQLATLFALGGRRGGWKLGRAEGRIFSAPMPAGPVDEAQPVLTLPSGTRIELEIALRFRDVPPSGALELQALPSIADLAVLFEFVRTRFSAPASGYDRIASGDGLGDGCDRRIPRIAITEPVGLRRAGREMALLVGSTAVADRSDPSLVRLIAKAWALRQALVSTTAQSLTAAAVEQGISQSYATRLVRLAWLAPDIVEAILRGCQPTNLTASRLMQDTRIPTDWQDQRKALGFV